MTMHEKNIRSAQAIIRIAAILRLLFIALLALKLAGAYADEHENIVRMYHENSNLGFLVPGFLLEMVLTVLWMRYPKLHTVHLVVYILIGGYYYLAYVFDAFNMYGLGALVAFFIAPCIWLVGLIPFIVCDVGRRKLKRAQAAALSDLS